MNCAEKLNSSPLECICFEDSFNGMISAKAARMQCVVVPAAELYDQKQWDAADLKLRSLNEYK
jgi:sugar-phosphatase